jgi:hypothetical protein
VKVGGQSWRTVVSAVTLSGKSYRLLRPASPKAHTPLYDSAGRGAPEIVVNEAAAFELACAWWLATRSPNSLIHLPLRQASGKCGAGIEGRALDLVLLHHSLQFPVTQWKELRARATSWTPHTVRLPAQPFPEITQSDYDRRWHRGFHDHLLWETAADTLFVIGSRPAFELSSNQVRKLAEDGPAHIARNPDTHCCAEIEIGRTLRYQHRNPPTRLHVTYCETHR